MMVLNFIRMQFYKHCRYIHGAVPGAAPHLPASGLALSGFSTLSAAFLEIFLNNVLISIYNVNLFVYFLFW